MGLGPWTLNPITWTLNPMNNTRPWSTIGYDVTNLSIGEAFESAGINFTVSVQPGYLSDGTRATGHYYIVRDDTKMVLGACRRKFQPMQNEFLASICLEIVTRDIGRLDTIGIFNNGERVWVLIKLNVDTRTVRNGDHIEHFLLLMNGHDGKTSIGAGILPFRISCSNMLPTIGRYVVRFRHTARAEERITGFVDDLVGSFDKINGSFDEMKAFTCIEMTLQEAFEYWRRCLGGKPTNNTLETIKKYYTGDTLWDAYNAINSYYNYNYGRTEENRLKALFSGTKITKCLNLAIKYMQTDKV